MIFVWSAERYSEKSKISGWHLPSSTGTGSYITLVQNYVGREGDTDGPENIDSSILLPQLGFTRSGAYYYGDGTLDSQSSGGRYWLRTRNGTTYAYRLRFSSTYLYLRNYDSRGLGFPLRCLAR